MSFSSDVKSELFDYYEKSRHCNIAELSAIVLLNGTFYERFGKSFFKLQTENYFVAVKAFKLIKIIFSINCEINIRLLKAHKKNIYTLYITDSVTLKDFISALGIYDTKKRCIKKAVDGLVVKGVCCKRAFIRGAFLSVGSLCNPEKTYHLEFVADELQFSEQLKALINVFEIESKIIERKKHFVVYIKEGEQIVELLNVISAHKSLMNLENVRIIKDVRNNVNRIVNCETANLNKIVSASVRQRDAIEYIRDTVGLSYLPKQLKEIAEARLDYPDLSLKELGEKLVIPVGKSGVNHRLKKINSIAEKLKEDFI